MPVDQVFSLSVTEIKKKTKEEKMREATVNEREPSLERQQREYSIDKARERLLLRPFIVDSQPRACNPSVGMPFT
jgi:hypothetical protein